MALPTPTPTADLALAYTATAGGVTVDLVQTAIGDAAVVTGQAKLLQDITTHFVTPTGTRVLDPSFGNGLVSEIGTPQGHDGTTLDAMVDDTEAAFLARQARDAALGYVAQDELVSRFSAPTVTRLDPVTSLVTFTIETQTALQLHLSVPLS